MGKKNLIYIYKAKSQKDLHGQELKKRKSRAKLCIRFVAPAQEAKAVAPLAPIFGQFGLNCPDFCKQFNEKTVTFEPGLLLTVYLDVMFDRTFRFNADRIFFTELLIGSADSNFLISDHDVFCLVMIHMFLYKQTYKQSLRTVGGTFHASRLHIRGG